MAGRKKLPDHLLKNPRRPKPQKQYNIREPEKRGQQRREPRAILAFWREYTMDQVQAMTDQEIIQAIDKCLNEFEARQLLYNKKWEWPINKDMLTIAPYEKK